MTREAVMESIEVKFELMKQFETKKDKERFYYKICGYVDAMHDCELISLDESFELIEKAAEIAF